MWHDVDTSSAVHTVLCVVCGCSPSLLCSPAFVLLCPLPRLNLCLLACSCLLRLSLPAGSNRLGIICAPLLLLLGLLACLGLSLVGRCRTHCESLLMQ